MLRLAPLLLLSGCGFFFPYAPGPTIDDDGGVFEAQDAGAEDGGPSRTFDRVNCTFAGKKLYGKIEYVTSFPDVKVRVVTALPDLRVKTVSSLATSCGEWREVSSLPDLRVKLVDSFEDLEIEYVTSFPGIP